MPMELTVKRIGREPRHFVLTARQQSGKALRSLRMNAEALVLHLRDWNVGERTIRAILSVPIGATVTFTVTDTGYVAT
jgi:hypothetical protein